MANFLDKIFYNIDYNFAKFFSLLQGKFVTKIMEFISFLGFKGIIMILLALVLCVFVKTRRMGATIIFSIAISAVLVSVIIKPLVQRGRPYTNTDLEFYKWWGNAGSHLEDSYSFPSGHTSAAMAFAMSVFANLKNKKLGSLIFVFPVLMACSRVYLMVHYFSDCVFGLLVGGVSVILAYFIVMLIFDKTKGKFNNFVNNFKLFNKNSKK